MNSELIVRRAKEGHYNVLDPADPDFLLKEISEAQLLGYLKNRKIVGMTAEEVLRQACRRKLVCGSLCDWTKPYRGC